MTRPLRIEYAGAHYHVTSRGNERKAIFRDDTDREKFLLTKPFKPFQPFNPPDQVRGKFKFAA